ncbi:alpha/beta hydrolase [Nocardia tengchongensis]|uniref:Alpha/beta hydrolase n=1 Tax=Nocardia tengchongensis TaxID=2055889 RepID=A0ABX8CV40_9NOCA|nr:alpha/beta hydrolase [Nocardia tengchongensis]QVI23765.1 alpha/beta hydrolase [Nocardia tengchongensis]
MTIFQRLRFPRTTWPGAAITTVIAIGVGSAAIASTTSIQAGPTEDVAQPTIVLVHGAFADGSSWNDVIDILHKNRYAVVAPANPLRGLASDADALRSLLTSIDGPVVLVGHSYGGSVISAAAAGLDQVKALVYLAAFLPAPGESAAELSSRFPGSTLAEALTPVPIVSSGATIGTDLYIRQNRFHDQFAADVPTDRTSLAAVSQRPIAQAALEERATTAAWTEKPSWDVISTKDRNIPAAAQRFMAERAHAQVTEVDSSHAVAVSHPDLVADVIEQAARSAAH